MSVLHVYEKHEKELVCKNVSTITVVVKGDELQVVPIDEAVQRAKTDREFRRAMKYPEDLERQVNDFLAHSLNVVRQHCLDRLLILNPTLTIKSFHDLIGSLSNKIRRSFLELAKNCYWHGNFGEARSPIRIEMAIQGHTGETDDRIVMNFSDCGTGIKDEEATAEGGYGRAIVQKSMDLVHDYVLDPPDGVFRFTVVTSRNLLRDMLIKPEVTVPVGGETPEAAGS